MTLSLPHGLDEQRDANLVKTLKAFKAEYAKYLGRKVTMAIEV